MVLTYCLNFLPFPDLVNSAVAWKYPYTLFGVSPTSKSISDQSKTPIGWAMRVAYWSTMWGMIMAVRFRIRTVGGAGFRGKKFSLADDALDQIPFREFSLAFDDFAASGCRCPKIRGSARSGSVSFGTFVALCDYGTKTGALQPPYPR